MFGWQAEWCQPDCFIRSIPEHYSALWSMFWRCRDVGQGGLDINPLKVRAKLEINDIPQEHWSDIDAQLDDILDVVQEISGKRNVPFEEPDAKLFLPEEASASM